MSINDLQTSLGDAIELSNLAESPRRLDFQTLVDFGIGKWWCLQGNLTLKTDLYFLNLLNGAAVDDSTTCMLHTGDEIIPGNWVKPRRLMLRIGLEF